MTSDMSTMFHEALLKATQRSRNKCARRGQRSFSETRLYISRVHTSWEGSNITWWRL